MKAHSRLSNENIKNQLSRPSTSGFIDEKPIKPEVDQIGRNEAQMKDNSRLSNQLIRNHRVSTSTYGFIAKKLTVSRKLIRIVVTMLE